MASEWVDRGLNQTPVISASAHTCEHDIGVEQGLQRRVCGRHRLHHRLGDTGLLQPDVHGSEQQLGHLQGERRLRDA